MDWNCTKYNMQNTYYKNYIDAVLISIMQQQVAICYAFSNETYIFIPVPVRQRCTKFIRQISGIQSMGDDLLVDRGQCFQRSRKDKRSDLQKSRINFIRSNINKSNMLQSVNQFVVFPLPSEISKRANNKKKITNNQIFKINRNIFSEIYGLAKGVFP